MPTDIEIAWKALRAKQAAQATYWAYYDGDQPLMYTANRLNEIFRNLDARFVQNWCAVVIDSCNERINLKGLLAANNPEAQKILDAQWEKQELSLESDEVHLAMQVTGEAYVIAWKEPAGPSTAASASSASAQDTGSEEGAGETQVYYNDPSLCYVHYATDNPRQKAWAAKCWVNDAGKLCLTVYYRDRLEYYVTTKAADKVMNAKAFEPAAVPVAVNPYGVIPVFHYRTQKRALKSDLKNVVPLQNGINKLLVDMMVAAEYSAFKQRWVISQAETFGKLKNAPNEIWHIPAGDGQQEGTQVGEFSENNLENYLKPIGELAGSVASITRTPRHYFFQEGGDPSGEALLAMEGPLNKKAQDRIDRAAPVWKDVASFILQLEGMDVPRSGITPVFDDPRTVQPLTQAQVRESSVRSGIPLTTLLRDEGKGEAWLTQMQKDKAAEGAAQQTTLAQALLEQQRQFDQGGNQGG